MPKANVYAISVSTTPKFNAPRKLLSYRHLLIANHWRKNAHNILIETYTCIEKKNIDFKQTNINCLQLKLSRHKFALTKINK